MNNNYMKRHSRPLVIKKMLIVNLNKRYYIKSITYCQLAKREASPHVSDI